jgi:predicted dehydrogenase
MRASDPAIMSSYRLAVAGAGSIGQAHIGVVRSSASCVPSAPADPSPAAAEAARPGTTIQIGADWAPH